MEEENRKILEYADKQKEREEELNKTKQTKKVERDKVFEKVRVVHSFYRILSIHIYPILTWLSIWMLLLDGG